mmetsp:Transcript_97638/g.276738  ORF Transcript_97638/g.276738 Transcript_97638/m.276738 type:complete len:243 (-) Transcript_97638:575-1303(-)
MAGPAARTISRSALNSDGTYCSALPFAVTAASTASRSSRSSLAAYRKASGSPFTQSRTKALSPWSLATAPFSAEPLPLFAASRMNCWSPRCFAAAPTMALPSIMMAFRTKSLSSLSESAASAKLSPLPSTAARTISLSDLRALAANFSAAPLLDLIAPNINSRSPLMSLGAPLSKFQSTKTAALHMHERQLFRLAEDDIASPVADVRPPCDAAADWTPCTIAALTARPDSSNLAREFFVFSS